MAQFQDNFTDGNFTANPVWLGDVTNFEVNASNQLHLNAPAVTDESHLVVATSAAVDGFWEFYVQLDLNPSTSNRAFVYLISDQQNLEGNLNGYYVKIGGASGTVDDVSLYKQTGSSSTKIIDGIDGTVAISPKLKVKVTRDLTGNFELFIDTSASLNSYVSQGIVFDNEFMESSYFGVFCDYTSTKSDKFYFDDFNISAQQYVDVFAPNITAFEVINLTTLKLSFDEELNLSTAENVNNYIVDNGIANPISAVYNNADKTVLLSFTNQFQANTNYTLSVSNIEDLNSNVLNTSQVFQIENAYEFNSIVFNEILADETPSNGLPTYEFIEFKNLQSDTLFTEGWFLSDLTDTTYFNTDTILPNEFVIVGKTTAQTFYEGFGKTFGLTSFISLNKSEDKLTLYNKYGAVIDSLHYYDDWFRNQKAPNDVPKVDGGWTLERIFDDFSCQDSYNWFPSVATLGGTPGAENSIHDMVVDTVSNSKIVSASIVNDTLVKIVFENVSNALDVNMYEIATTGSDYITIFNISNIYYENGSYFLVILDGITVNSANLTISNVENCYGESSDLRTTIYRIKAIEKGDLVLNEILYNPYSGAEDYLEIYNTTDFALNLKGMQIVEYDIFDEDTISDFSDKFSEDFIMPPSSYFTFSEDTLEVAKNYIVNT